MKKLSKLLFALCVISFMSSFSPLFGQIATDSFSSIGSGTPSILSNDGLLPQTRSLSSAYFHDGLDGSCLGASAFSSYTQGVLGQAARFSGTLDRIGYAVGSQIAGSGFISFYFYSNGYRPSYGGCNWIFTQAGFGGAARGSIQLMLNANNQLLYSQHVSGWNYMTTEAIPLNTWVKITAV